MEKLCKLWIKYVNYGKNMVTFNKTPLGETGCLDILYFLLSSESKHNENLIKDF